MVYRFVISLLITMLSVAVCYAQHDSYYPAPFQMRVLQNKGGTKNRFRDIRGHFKQVKVELTNTDQVAHIVDYTCFCLVDNEGFEYDADWEATLIKESEIEDLKSIDNQHEGFLRKYHLRPNFSMRGYLLFEIPRQGDYKVKFRGYKK